MFTRGLRYVVSGLLLVSATAAAQDRPVAPLTLRDAITRVMDSNPKLTSQGYALAAADAVRDQAALRPPVDLGLEVENLFGTNNLSTFDDTEVTLQIGTVLELRGKRDLRRAAAERERDLIAIGNDAEKLDLVADTARRFIALVQAERERDLATSSASLAANARRVAAERAASGRGTALETANAGVAVSRATIESAAADTAVKQAWIALAALWNGTSNTQPTAADLFTLPTLTPREALEQALDDNPDLIRFATERRVADAKLRLAEVATTPDVSVAAGLRRIQAARSNALVFSASVPLGSAGRAGPGIAESRARGAELEARERAARAELKATLLGVHLEAERRAAELAVLQATAIPEADTSARLADSGFAAGRFSLLDLLTAQGQLLDLRRQALSAAAAYHLAIVELERLTGRIAADPTAPHGGSQ